MFALMEEFGDDEDDGDDDGDDGDNVDDDGDRGAEFEADFSGKGN